ncbi:MAG TPA: hypothetical protein VK928_04220 [Longimicrobiales bacterium]|nr:hypothetical protein [Longimicrobiales bacterium]
MRRLVLLFATATASAVGCAPAEEEPAQEQAAAAPTVSLADLAGAWTVTATAESSDSVLITYELNATATQDGWTSTLPGREPMPVRVLLVDGDSVVAEAGPFESALRPDVMVTTRTVARLQGDVLTGTMVAHYDTDAAGDSVLVGRLRGIRKTQ